MSAVKGIYAGIRAMGIADEDDRRDFFERVSGKRRLRDMTPAEKDGVLGELRRMGFKPRGRKTLTGPYAKKLQALWISAWNLGIVKSRDDRALLAFVERQTGLKTTAWLQNPRDADKAIDSLKKWIEREGGVEWATGEKPNWMKKSPAAQVAWAQWFILADGQSENFVPGFEREVFEITGRALTSMRNRDWQNVVTKLGFQVRLHRAVKPLKEAQANG